MLCSSTWNGSVSRSCLEVFTGDADLCSLREDDFSDGRHCLLDSMAPWRCGRGGERAALYRISRMWFLHVEKCEFSGPALDLMTHASETD